MEFHFTEANLPRLLEQCHGALMLVWINFQRQMTRRGYATVDFIGEVASRVWLNREQFDGTTIGEFCRWSGQIARTMCLQKLAFLCGQTGAIRPGLDPPDRSTTPDRERKRRALLLGLAQLTPTDQALVEARFGQEKKLPIDRVAEYLQQKHPAIWQANAQAWSADDALSNACGNALARLNEEGNKALRLLEDGPDECAPQ